MPYFVHAKMHHGVPVRCMCSTQLTVKCNCININSIMASAIKLRQLQLQNHHQCHGRHQKQHACIQNSRAARHPGLYGKSTHCHETSVSSFHMKRLDRGPGHHGPYRQAALHDGMQLHCTARHALPMVGSAESISEGPRGSLWLALLKSASALFNGITISMHAMACMV